MWLLCSTKHFAIEYDRVMNCYVVKLFDNHSIKILEDPENTNFVKVSEYNTIEVDIT